MDKFVPNGKYITILLFFEQVSKNFSLSFWAENNFLQYEIKPWNKFERFIIILPIMLKSKVDFFVTPFLEVFYFSCVSIIVIKDLEKRFLRGFASKYMLPIIQN